MSKPLSAGNKDWKSAFRHTIIPALAGGVLIVVNAIDPTLMHLSPVMQALVVAGLSGLGRLAQRFTQDIPESQVPGVAGELCT